MKVEIYENKIWDWNIQDSIHSINSDRKSMFEAYTNQGTQILIPYVISHAPLLGVLDDFLTVLGEKPPEH